MSFSDLMSALLIIFILAVVALIVQLTIRQDELGRIVAELETVKSQADALRSFESQRNDLVAEMRDDLVELGIDVQVSDDGGTLRIPSDVLTFEQGRWELAANYVGVASQIGSVVAERLREENRYSLLDTVFVEGHADGDPFDEALQGNWGLSAFRAIELWRFWESALPPDSGLASLRTADGKPLFSVSGYGDQRRVVEAETSESDKAENRRIDIRFVVRNPSGEEIAQLAQTIDGELE
jgi:flagellar motor protein MotB